jgi:hypothetical protein
MSDNTYGNHNSETIVVVVHTDDDDNDDTVVSPNNSQPSSRSGSGSGLIATLFALIMTALIALALF